MNTTETKAFIAELEAMEIPERHKFIAETIHQESDPAILKEKLVAIFDNFNFSMSRSLFIETNGNHEAIADLIIKNKVEASKSDDRDNPGMVLRFAFENPEREHLFETDSELLDRAIGWLNVIAECSGKITSGDASHMGMTVKGKALRSIEFINKHRMKK